MKILSIDVGIKNLAYCLFEIDYAQQPKIVKWNSIDLTQTDQNQAPIYCQEIKIGKICKTTKEKCCKLAKYIYCSKYYCAVHAKKTDHIIPSNKTTVAAINKLKVQMLHDLALKYNMEYSKTTIKKPELVTLLNEFIKQNSFLTTLSSTTPINASKLDLVTIGRNIQIKFNEMLQDIDISTISTVIIENQISPIANRMKTIQGMIAQYFIMTNNNIKIDFVSAANKLKTGTSGNCLTSGNIGIGTDIGTNTGSSDITITSYKNRKKAGIQMCLEHIIHDLHWHTFFMAHNKKDDLADSFLQGIWYINSKITVS